MDANGNPLTSEAFSPGGNPCCIAIDPNSESLFFSAVNANFVGVVDLADASVHRARIDAVCDNLISSPLTLTFSPVGDLYVGCANHDGATTDIVAFPANELVGVSGTVTASALNARRIKGEVGGVAEAGASHLIYVSTGPTNKDDCKDDGWEQFGFSNQGQCVRFVETGDSR